MSKTNPLHGRVQHYAAHGSAVDFFNALTAPGLLDCLDAHLPAHRERLFPPTETLSMFLAQALSADGSCRWTVDQAATFRVLAQLPCCSTATGGYCRARARLPLALIQQLTRKTARQCEAQPPAHWHSTGRPVRVVDGTTLSLPDTPANQARYPQPRSQRTGLGFPICRVVAAFNLADGALMDAAIGGYRGKGAHEQALLRELLEGFAPDDILLGDARIKGDLFRMLTAWNAGPGNLNKWSRKVQHNNDPLLFIESIPSPETRIFVERVLTNYWIYRMRLRQPTPSLDATASGLWPNYLAQERSFADNE